MSSPSGGGPSGGQVDLATLSTAQLSQLKKQLDSELEHLTSSFASLRGAQAKFRECIKSIGSLASPGISTSTSTSSTTSSTSNPTSSANSTSIPAAAASASAATTASKSSTTKTTTGPGASSSSSSAATAAATGTNPPPHHHLIPLTSSLYVPGSFASTEHVLVDVGTGFYVEKKLADAKLFYGEKVKELEKNLKDLETIVQGKGQNLRLIEEVLRQKMLAGEAAPAAA